MMYLHKFTTIFNQMKPSMRDFLKQVTPPQKVMSKIEYVGIKHFAYYDKSLQIIYLN